MKTGRKLLTLFLYVLAVLFGAFGFFAFFLDREHEMFVFCIILIGIAVLFFSLAQRSRTKLRTESFEAAEKAQVRAGGKLTVEEAIKRSGTFNPMNKASTKAAQDMLSSNEIVIHAVNTNIAVLPNIGKLDASNAFSFATLKNRINGPVVITNRRIFFCNNSLGNVTSKQMPLQSIQSVDEASNGLMGVGQLRISGLTEMFVLDLQKPDIKIFVQKLDEARAAIITNASNTTVINNTSVDTAGELRKYADLLNDGIISQEEFDAKKKQLLRL